MKHTNYNEILDEKINVKTLPSGLKCYIIPKKGYVESQGLIAINYGSTDIKFKVKGKTIESPAGMAHFLEHKLFENKQKNIFYEFSKQGGSVNAFTNFTNTAYYFNCIDNFYDNLKLLLEFTANPYFTDENVEKEKGIITEEINMYLDNPFWQVYFNMLNAMYSKSTIKENIAGSAESIDKITKEILYDCYNIFYNPKNMALICVGDLDEEEIYKISKDYMTDRNDFSVEVFREKEPDNINQSYIEEKMNISIPMFNIGFKETDLESNVTERIVSSKLIMDIICGESSLFFQNLYNNNLLDAPISLEYTNGKSYGTVIFSGSSDSPKKVQELLNSEIKNLQKNGIDKKRFEQIKRKHIGRYKRSFNNIDAIATAQVDLFYKNIELFNIMDCYTEITQDQVQQRLQNLFAEDRCVLSVVSSK